MIDFKYYINSIFSKEYVDFGTEVLSSIPACVKVFDVKFNLMFINSWGIREHFIDSEQECESHNHELSVVKEDWLKVKTAFDEALSGKISYVEFRHIPEKSRHEWCYSTISPLKANNGEIKYVLFSSVDITHYKEESLQAKKDEKMFSLLLESAPLCIKWFDNKGNLLSVNKGAREEHHLVEKTEEEIKSWDYWSCIDPAYHNSIKQYMKEAITEQKTTSFDMKHVPGTSNGLWCHSVISPVKDEEGNVEFVLFLSQDITEQKQYMDEISKMNKMMVDRELKMVELKKELDDLKKKLDK